jgi:hypothetical protein
VLGNRGLPQMGEVCASNWRASHFMLPFLKSRTGLAEPGAALTSGCQDIRGGDRVAATHVEFSDEARG